MSNPHPEYREYATCTVHKYCRQVNRYLVCYSCEHGNFAGIKNINNKTKEKQ